MTRSAQKRNMAQQMPSKIRSVQVESNTERKAVAEALLAITVERYSQMEDIFIKMYDLAKSPKTDKLLHDTIVNRYLQPLCGEMMNAREMANELTNLPDLLKDVDFASEVSEDQVHYIYDTIYNGIKKQRADKC